MLLPPSHSGKEGATKVAAVAAVEVSISSFLPHAVIPWRFAFVGNSQLFLVRFQLKVPNQNAILDAFDALLIVLFKPYFEASPESASRLSARSLAYILHLDNLFPRVGHGQPPRSDSNFVSIPPSGCLRQRKHGHTPTTHLQHIVVVVYTVPPSRITYFPPSASLQTWMYPAEIFVNYLPALMKMDEKKETQVAPAPSSPTDQQSVTKKSNDVPAAVAETGGTGNDSTTEELVDGHALQHSTGINRFLALTALACMWVSAQAPLYLFAAAPVYIYRELGGVDHWIWFITANLLATAVISPFVGALSDVFGRRWAALLGSMFIIIGQVVCGTAHNMDIFIAGMALSGIGTGINELTAIAGTAELVPTSQRGYYVAVIVLTILPFMPSVLYAQLIASRSTWRYIAFLTSGTALVGLVMTFLFYKPPAPAAPMEGKKALLRKTDLTGGLLSIIGLAGLEIGLLGGGYQHPWGSAHVLAPLIIGILFIVFFVIWEFWITENPMLPRRLGKAPRTLILTIIITTISGANFFAVLMLWPGEAYNVYGHNPIGIGIRGLPFAFGTLTGCFISLVLISRLGGANIRYILLGASILMTAGCGGLAVARPDNISTVYPILFLAGLGVGGIIVPPSTMATFICPSDLIATITALTIAVRIVGGAIGYAVYYNVFANKLGPALVAGLGEACAKVGITDMKVIGGVVGLTAAGLIPELEGLLAKAGVDEAGRQAIVATGQVIYATAYPWVYYCSIAFGGVAILASMFLEDISEFVDDNIAVVI